MELQAKKGKKKDVSDFSGKPSKPKDKSDFAGKNKGPKDMSDFSGKNKAPKNKPKAKVALPKSRPSSVKPKAKVALPKSRPSSVKPKAKVKTPKNVSQGSSTSKKPLGSMKPVSSLKSSRAGIDGPSSSVKKKKVKTGFGSKSMSTKVKNKIKGTNISRTPLQKKRAAKRMMGST